MFDDAVIDEVYFYRHGDRALVMLDQFVCIVAPWTDAAEHERARDAWPKTTDGLTRLLATVPSRVGVVPLDVLLVWAGRTGEETYDPQIVGGWPFNRRMIHEALRPLRPTLFKPAVLTGLIEHNDGAALVMACGATTVVVMSLETEQASGAGDEPMPCEWTPADEKTRVVAECAACGHVHAGPSLAGICIGCPCEART